METASGVRWLDVEDRQLEVLIKCPNEAAQEKVLELNGWDCPGGTLKVRWATRRLTVAEMCRWVERGLRVENELLPAKFSPRRVNAVRDDSPRSKPEPGQQTKGTSEGRGRKGSKGPRKGAARAVTPGREAWSPRNQPERDHQSRNIEIRDARPGQRVDCPAPGPARAEEAGPRETSVSPAIRRDGTAGTHTRIANFGKRPGKRWD